MRLPWGGPVAGRTGRRTDWTARVITPGPLPAPAIAEYLRACDLVLQPYPDGASGRRTTLMTALANGVPVVTTLGVLYPSRSGQPERLPPPRLATPTSSPGWPSTCSTARTASPSWGRPAGDCTRTDSPSATPSPSCWTRHERRRPPGRRR